MRSFCILLAVMVLSLTASAQTVDPGMASAMAPAADVAAHHRARRQWATPALGRSASGDPEVLFTFDDGPGSATAAVLDTLKAHGVKAVFFMVGHRMGHAGVREIVTRVLAEGHAIGNHTVGHRDLCLRSNRAKIPAEIDDAARLIDQVTGMTTVLFRAPFGVRCQRLEQALGERGLAHMHWDVDPQEWKTHDAVRTKNIIVRALRRLPDGQRAVVLTHDTHEWTARALPTVLDWIAAENLRRRASGRREIRVIAPSDVVLEQLAPGVMSLLSDSSASALVPDLARLFLDPLTVPRAHAGTAPPL